jgi:glucose repression regulatory protein TUP1
MNEEIILRVFKGHEGEIFCLDFAANGFFVGSGSRDNTVRIWQPHDGASKTIFVDPSDKPVACVAISPDCGILAAGSMDNNVRV